MSVATTEQNRQIVKAMYAAASSGDFQGFMQYVDENIVVLEPPYLPYGGAYRGLDEFMKLMGAISQYADPASLKIQSIVADGDIVIGVLQLTDKNGKPLLLAEQSTIRNGKVVELKIFYHDTGSMIGA